MIVKQLHELGVIQRTIRSIRVVTSAITTTARHRIAQLAVRVRGEDGIEKGRLVHDGITRLTATATAAHIGIISITVGIRVRVGVIVED